MERATGVEPASEAWEASILPMNYARRTSLVCHKTHPFGKNTTHRPRPGRTRDATPAYKPTHRTSTQQPKHRTSTQEPKHRTSRRASLTQAANPATATKNPAVLREQRGKRGDDRNRRKNPSTCINAEKFLFVGHPWDTRTGSAPLQTTPEPIHQPIRHSKFARHRTYKPIA